jgi:hypothetical protein
LTAHLIHSAARSAVPVSDVILAALAVCFLLLVASVVAYRRTTAVLEPDHREDCRHCAELRHPANRSVRSALSSFPRQTRGGE